jgi:type VI secretion system protein ImpM
MDPLPEVGFFGKLPTHGDFLRRRVSDAFIGPWDAWLQECLAASRSALGDRWLDVYLTSPVWRFACAAGACGPEPVAGVIVPSVDRVGRYFPLTIVARLPPAVSLMTLAAGAGAFFDHAERLVLDLLAAETVDFEGFDASVASLAAELGDVIQPLHVTLDPAAAGVLGDGDRGPWHLPIGSSAELTSALSQVLGARLSALYDPLTLWWTDGSSIVDSSGLLLSGLPRSQAFASLFDGAWADRQWRSIPARIEGEPLADVALLGDTLSLRYRSAAASDAGRVRPINQDSFVERTDVGLWAVADGLGGHSDGEIASRMVCDALADFVPGAGFGDMVDTAGRRIADVNDHLSRAATSLLNPVQRGSTVVVLLTRGTRCAVLWAGDSRAYRWRNGRLQQLTHDHSATETEGAPSTAITRAVGSEPTLTLDQYRDSVQTGDRFLLCSDGLTRVLSDEAIRGWMEQSDIHRAVDGLLQSTLEAGAPDNVTALIVEAAV